jgi:glycerol-3-phosphate acyltransferase PlsY
MDFSQIVHFILPGLAVAAIAYLLGSISFSIIFTKVFKNHEDIRTYGSGNAGATNVLRSVGKGAAALTFVFDFLKCALSVIIGKMIFGYFAGMFGAPLIIMQYGAYIAGCACLLGHVFPVYFGFRGGKGVVTSAAMMALIDWRVFVLVLLTFIIAFACKKIVSLGSLLGALVYPIATFLITFFFDYKMQFFSMVEGATLTYVITSTVLSLLISATVAFLHRGNIKRLLAGEEKKLSLGHSEKS